MPDFTLDDADALAHVTRLIEIEKAGERAVFAVGPFTAFTLVGVIQLATRHPELGAFSKDALRELGDQMIETWFAGTQLHPVLVAGWDPAHDR
jgi:hypothetical protein